MSLSNARAILDGYGGSVALQCEADGARWHVWVDPATMNVADAILYKNPPPGNAADYRTKKLDAGAAVHRLLVSALLEAGPRLIAEARAEKAAEVERDRLRREADERDEHVRAVAPALLEALVKIRKLSSSAGIRAIANAAIAKAKA